MSIITFFNKKILALKPNKGNPYNYHLDRVIRTKYRHTTHDRILINGWFHNGVCPSKPFLELFYDEKLSGKIRLNQVRIDVEDIFGKCNYDTGFLSIFDVPAGAKNIQIIEPKSKQVLYEQNIADLMHEEISDYEYRSQKAIQDIPLKLRQDMAKKLDDFEFESGGGSYQQTYFSLLKYFSQTKSTEKGYNIFGYISGVFGLSEAARAYIDSLFEAKENFILVDYAEPSHAKISPEEEAKYISRFYQPFKYDTNIFLLDAGIIRILLDNCPEIFENKKNILSFWWEFETGFEDRVPLLNTFDEILVFSDFIKEVLNKVPNRKFKVRKIKYPFYIKWQIEENASIIKSRYGLENKFCFFFNFDYASGYNRKNPEASLRAFFEEFKNEDDVLILYKTNSNNTHQERLEKFNKLIEQYQLEDKVLILDKSFTKNGIMTLLNAMDCYISLHRGEGLGLGILEALHLNIPVIATDYGGNAEYMNHHLAHPVSFELIPTKDDYEIYKNVKEWAEPSHEMAKKLMREVYENANTRFNN
ncbi:MULTISPECIES: glycosyltransferase [unclassified Lentimicrobium]|uniref:glycosyltransferase n=1 Tax=unclassified Lentimicrobium TaxID=2677434 RepID=UPI00155196B5|nr:MULTISPECIES: glycosyltransferase [unclassified Lentimicrobium]NPD45554.1 glycosyltransferase family 4 protein [Lentimicrobium sp. S6]NPD83633.1 glycosyltransferase family 4 protein [Lentimicrobium sp. L6]